MGWPLPRHARWADAASTSTRAQSPRHGSEPLEDDSAPSEPLLSTVFDPGWPFLIAAIAMLFATVLIPAFERLDAARWERDRALAFEDNRRERLELHQRYLTSIEQREPNLVRALAVQQLNRVPVGEALLIPEQTRPTSTIAVFHALEPGPIAMQGRLVRGSALERWTTDERIRPWLIMAGGVLLLIGLLPRAAANAADARRQPERAPMARPARTLRF